MQVRVTLKKLKDSKEIITNVAPSYQLVTILKYDDYQSKQACDNTQITPEQHPNNTQRNTQITPNNNENNDNNNRSTDIKFLNDAYVKNERLHQLTYNNRTLKIRLFKLTLRGLLYFDVIIVPLSF